MSGCCTTVNGKLSRKMRACRRLHLAAADGEEDGAAARADGRVEVSHDGVKRVAGTAWLADDGLGLLQLRPDSCHLFRHIINGEIATIATRFSCYRQGASADKLHVMAPNILPHIGLARSISHIPDQFALRVCLSRQRLRGLPLSEDDSHYCVLQLNDIRR
jgi:hypothetical protein